jgi:hypothetical protein
MKIIAIVTGGLIGAIVGYFIGVYAGCNWLYPTSNLCGIYGMLVTGPVGLVAGTAGVWFLSRKKLRAPPR